MRLRAGFTLLEMILALAIGILLMYSLYSVLSQQVQQAQHGRLTLHEGTLARSILTRMTSEILCSLGPVNTFVQPDPSAAASTPSTTTPTTGTTTDSTTTPSDTTGGVQTNSTVTFNLGVYGTSSLLVLNVSKVPRELIKTDPTQQALVCDLRRISYWQITSRGLARQEVIQATSTDLATVPPDIDDAESYVIAPEVKDVSFQYWDGTTWLDYWDGSELGGVTGDIPIGPPSAIAITLTFNRRGADNVELEESSLPKYRHVVNIPAGNSFPQP